MSPGSSSPATLVISPMTATEVACLLRSGPRTSNFCAVARSTMACASASHAASSPFHGLPSPSL